MATANSEDTPVKKINKPIIRTMEEDLKSLRAIAMSLEKDLSNLSEAPANLPIDSPPNAGSLQPQKNTRSAVEERSSVPPPVKPAEKSLPNYAENKKENNMERAFVNKVPPAVPVKTPPVFASPAAHLPEKEKKIFAVPPRETINQTSAFKKQNVLADESFKNDGRNFLEESDEDIPPELRLLKQNSPFSKIPEKKPAKDNFLEKVIEKSKDGLPASSISSENKNIPTKIAPAAQKSISAPSAGSFAKVLRSLAIVLVVAAISYGAYYLITRNNSPVEAPAAVIPESLIPNLIQEEIFVDLKSDDIPEIIKYFSGVNSNGISKPAGVYRLIIKDTQGKEILQVENFKEALKMEIPSPVLGVLDKNYNLIAFNYPEKGYLRLGLAFKVGDPAFISENMKTWEPVINTNLQSLFLGDYKASVAISGFRSNAYKEASIRYLPLEKTGLFLNYAITKNNNFLLLATSKDDIYYLIDKISQ